MVVLCYTFLLIKKTLKPLDQQRDVVVDQLPSVGLASCCFGFSVDDCPIPLGKHPALFADLPQRHNGSCNDL